MPTAEKKVLVFGAQGMLGKTLLSTEASALALDGIDLPECDITSAEQVARTLDRIQPDWVVNAAAYTDVDGCESRPELAEAVNGRAPGSLALACRERGSRFLQVSTDFVFSGQAEEPYPETAEPGPLNEYGRSKLAGEKAVSAAGGDFVILRTSWLFGPRGKNFPRTILQAARSRPVLQVVDDQFGSPTFTRDLARAAFELIRREARGLFHFSGKGSCSWHSYANFVLNEAGLSTRVEPISSREAGRAAPRPAYSVLDCRHYEEFTGDKIRPWEEMVRSYLPSAIREINDD